MLACLPCARAALWTTSMRPPSFEACSTRFKPQSESRAPCALGLALIFSVSLSTILIGPVLRKLPMPALHSPKRPCTRSGRRNRGCRAWSRLTRGPLLLCVGQQGRVGVVSADRDTCSLPEADCRSPVRLAVMRCAALSSSGVTHRCSCRLLGFTVYLRLPCTQACTHESTTVLPSFSIATSDDRGLQYRE